MKNAQKIIKYVAIAFGLYLAINIIGLIILGFSMLLGIDVGLDVLSDLKNNKELLQYGQTFNNVEKLDIEIDFADLEIKTGDELGVEGQIYEDFKIEVQNNTLKIKDTNKKWLFNSSDVAKLIVYVPETFEFNEAEIDIGAGTTNIGQLKAKNLELNLGAGAVKIQNCYAKKSEIECGAGKVTIENSSLENLRFEAGVGEVYYNGYILGNSDIECGVGKMTLNLEGGIDLYSIRTEQGIGAIKLNGEKIGNNEKGNGENRVEIQGGIGEIEINM